MCATVTRWFICRAHTNRLAHETWEGTGSLEWIGDFCFQCNSFFNTLLGTLAITLSPTQLCHYDYLSVSVTCPKTVVCNMGRNAYLVSSLPNHSILQLRCAYVQWC